MESNEYGFNHQGKTFLPSGTGAIAESQAACDERNKQTSAAEVASFLRDKPERYFLYIKLTGPEPQPGNRAWRGRQFQNVRDDSGRSGIATNWMGVKLGDVTCGTEYLSPAFGGYSVRIPITVKAINGLTYHGTYYKSSGDYARVKAAKNRRA